MTPAKILALILSINIISAVTAARSLSGSDSRSESVWASTKNTDMYSLSRQPAPTESVVSNTGTNTNGNTAMYSLSRKPASTESQAMNTSGNTAMYSLSWKPASTESLSTNTARTAINDTTKYVPPGKQQTENCYDEPCQFLRAHNLVRTSLGEPPLTWDLDLEKYARWWVGQRKGDCALEHSFPPGEFKLGENLFWGGGSGWTPQNAVDMWADERKYYDYETNSCLDGQQCLHYTQIVWKKTTNVGCVRELCENGDVFVACNYSPPGNYEGETPY